jgi:hypothetical protein
LRDSVNCFQLHKQALSSWTWFNEMELTCSHGPGGRLRNRKAALVAPTIG